MKPTLTVLLLGLAACTTVRSESDVKVTNGAEASSVWDPLAPALEDRTSTQGIVAYCSSSVIGPNAVLTAAHCLMGFAEEYATENKRLFVLGKKSVEVVAPPSSFRSGTNDNFGPIDIAVIIYPDDTFANHLAVELGPLAKGDPVTMLGYGGLDAAAPPMVSPVVRIGHNVIKDFDEELVYLEGMIAPAAGVPAGENSATAKGDSGGPLLDGQDRVIAVTSYGFVEAGAKASYLARLGSKANTFLLCYAKARGAKIPSLKASACAAYPSPDQCAIVPPESGQVFYRVQCD